MGLETATYISDLNTSNPSSSDFLSQTDDHIRLLKATLKSTFPDANKPILLQKIVEIGTIVMWSPTAGAVPSGWAVCSGQTLTRTDGAGTIVAPDLRDKFIVASGATYAQGSTGGSTSYTTSSNGGHSHTGTTGGTALTVAQIPSHNHGVTDPGHTHTYVNGGIVGSGAPSLSNGTGSNTPTSSNTTGISIQNTGGGEAHTHSISSDGAHTHTLTNVQPPYYALLFIMKY